MPTQISVMTWNLENLFRPDQGATAEAQAIYQQKLQNLAATITRLAPDVLAVQEVGGQTALDDLQAALPGVYPHTRLAPTGDSRGIHVGFLSKLPLTHVEEIVAFPAILPSVPGPDNQPVTRMSRGALRVTVEPVANFPIHIVTAHLKSKLLTFPRSNGGTSFTPRNEGERAQFAAFALLRRTGEAVALRAYTNSLTVKSTDAVILLGDMNDVPEAATSQILVGPPDDRRHTPDKGDDARLFNLEDEIPAARRFSRIFQGTGELIDHIYVSVELRRERLVKVDSHVDGHIPSISTDPNARKEATGSDHAPVIATFQV